MKVDPAATAFLVVETARDGRPVWAVKRRSADGARVKRRLGHDAWMRRGAGGWERRGGRVAEGALSEYQARRVVPGFVADAERQLAARARRDAAPAAAAATFRELTHAWLGHLQHVEDAKPSTLRDHRALLAELGVAYRRGEGRTLGRIMKALGDVSAAAITTADIDALLRRLDGEPVARRTVNKRRATLHTIFQFGLTPEQQSRWRLQANPIAATRERRQKAPKHLEVSPSSRSRPYRALPARRPRDPAREPGDARVHRLRRCGRACVRRIGPTYT